MTRCIVQSRRWHCCGCCRCWLLLWTVALLIESSSAQNLRGVRAFDHNAFGDQADHEADLVVLLENGGVGVHIAPSKAALALRQLQAEVSVDGVSSGRPRKLVVEHCQGCRDMHTMLDRWRLDADVDLPLLMLFPHAREELEGRYRLPLLGTHDPKASMDVFLERYYEGNLHPWLQSEPLPQEQYSPVYELVGSTFQEGVLDDPRSTLVMFYTPWCGISRQMQPIMEDVARRLRSDNPYMRIARINHQLNDHPPHPFVSIRSVPAIVLYPRTDKYKPVWYTQAKLGRTTEMILEWLVMRDPQLDAWLQRASTSVPPEYVPELQASDATVAEDSIGNDL